MTVEELIDNYCEIWTQTDPTIQAELMAAVWADDGIYTDPTVDGLRTPDLLAHVARVQQTRPGATLRRTTSVDEHHAALRFGFAVTGADGTILRHGVDFVELNPERTRIRRVIGFFGDLDAAAPAD